MPRDIRGVKYEQHEIRPGDFADPEDVLHTVAELTLASPHMRVLPENGTVSGTFSG
jgi:hypothetical protein